VIPCIYAHTLALAADGERSPPWAVVAWCMPRPGVGVCLHSMPSCLYADPLIGHPSRAPSCDATGNESSSQTHLLSGNLYLALAIEILAVYGPLILGPSNLVTCYYIAIFYVL